MSTASPAPWSVEHRVALVTGAASGLGARFATLLATTGSDVVITSRRADRLASLREEHPGRITCLAGDLTDPQHRLRLVEEIDRGWGRLDILVNNAGRCDDGPLETQQLDELVAVIDLNVVATLDLCRLAAPLLFRGEDATVVNVASMYGLVASAGPMAAYNASKGALVNLTRHLAAQWGERGVRVNALAPGYFPTEMTGGLADPEFRRSIEARTVLRRVPELEEIDGPFLFLVSRASSYVTGQTLVVDGGWTVV
jgi:NAD(P)-dependent dehydrogenase (short-subunit alcohol dehydrogenase family)